MPVVVFGVFSYLHPGHLFFLSKAAEYSTTVIIQLTRDSIVEKLKGKPPLQDQITRLEVLKQMGKPYQVELGDDELGRYSIFERLSPSETIICLGYDQDKLEEDLKKRMESGQLPTIRMIKIDSFEPERYHTSIMQLK